MTPPVSFSSELILDPRVDFILIISNPPPWSLPTQEVSAYLGNFFQKWPPGGSAGHISFSGVSVSNDLAFLLLGALSIFLPNTGLLQRQKDGLPVSRWVQSSSPGLPPLYSFRYIDQHVVYQWLVFSQQPSSISLWKEFTTHFSD